MLLSQMRSAAQLTNVDIQVGYILYPTLQQIEVQSSGESAVYSECCNCSASQTPL